MWSVWIDSPLPGAANRLRIGPPARSMPSLPGGSWVRVTNRLAGVSEEDLALVRGTARSAAAAMPRPRRRYLGHEVVGTVAEIGPDVTLVRVGDRVVLQTEPLSNCYTLGLQPPCHACAAANVSLCEHRVLPWAGTGAGWSDEMIVHEGQVFLVPAPLSDDAALLLLPAARALRAAIQRLPEPGANVLLLGGSALGQIALAAIRALAPGAELAMSAGYPYQAQAAAKHGEVAMLPAKPDALLEWGALHTNAQIFGRGTHRYILGGFDIVFDCLGSEQSLDQALRLTRSGGAVVMLAPPARAALRDTSAIWQDEVTVYGITCPGAESLPEDMAESIGAHTSSLALAARLVRKDRLHLDGIITHRLPAREIRQALAIAAQPERHKALRVALTFDA
jgi:L-iditol 2-dehydrogenase